MLYPKTCIIKKRDIFKEELDCIKGCFLALLKAFSSYSSFVLFMQQKFHF